MRDLGVSGPVPPAARRVTGRSPLAPGILLLLFLLAAAWFPGASRTPWPVVALWAGAFLSYAAALVSHGRRPVGRWALWTVAILGRLVLLPREPRFSDDIYRYMWDGWIQARGLLPFLHAPDSPALWPLRTEWHSLLNHPSVPTIYPPGAQLVFWVLAMLGPSVLLFKAAWVTADLGVGWVLDRLTARRGEPPSLAPVVYLWSPLALVEVAWSGHMEPLGILPMIAALLFLSRGRRQSPHPSLGGVLLGLGAAVKFAPAVAIPAATRQRLTAGGLAIGVLALSYLPYRDAGPLLGQGLATYAEHWTFNAGLFGPLAFLVGPQAARILAGGAVLACAAVATWKRWSVERTLYWTIGIALVLSPTLHPWYVLWILPLAALRGGRAWILLSGTTFLAYWGLDAYQTTGIWPQPLLARLAIHLPFLLLLARDGWASQALPQRGEMAQREQEAQYARRHGAASEEREGRCAEQGSQERTT